MYTDMVVSECVYILMFGESGRQTDRQQNRARAGDKKKKETKNKQIDKPYTISLLLLLL